MKKTLVAAVLLTALFAAWNANGTTVIKQIDENTNESTESFITDEHLISTKTPVEIISASEEVIPSNDDYCSFGVGRYRGEVSIHYYNDCDCDVKIGYKYQFKQCCPSCDCEWSSVQTNYATLSRKIKKEDYRTLKQGANQNMTYHLVEYWETDPGPCRQSTTRSSSSRNTSSSGSSRSSSYGTGTNSNNTLKEALAEAGGAAAAMAVVAIIVGSNDLYAHWATSQNYSGYNFGLKNSMSRRLDIEAGFGMYKGKEQMQAPAGFFRTDYSYDSRSFNWGFDVNAIYNLSPRRWIVNPYVGIGTTQISQHGSSFSLGGIAGISAGVWDDRLQLHVRYKWLKDFDYPKVMFNQIEVGLSVKYKRGWGFSEQTFYDPEEYNEGGVHFAIHAGLSTASAAAKIEDRSVTLQSRTGYNLMLYMAGNVRESLWAINWGIIGVSSLGWKMNGTQQNLYYLPMSLGTSYQINIPVDFLPLSILPFAGLQWGFLVDSNYDEGMNYNPNLTKYDDLTKFDIGPSLGAALRIDHTLELGAQYDIGLINVFKQGDESSRNAWKFYNRQLQFFTRVFF